VLPVAQIDLFDADSVDFAIPKPLLAANPSLTIIGDGEVS
jgi:hypothetical protein